MRVAAVAWVRDGALLLVRKRGTARFILPGGKLTPGEAPRDGARREVREELGVELAPDALTELGRFSAPAANEPGRTVDATIFTGTLEGAAPRAEIVELRWHPLSDDQDDLAPLLRLHVLPALRNQKEPRSPTSTG